MQLWLIFKTAVQDIAPLTSRISHWKIEKKYIYYMYALSQMFLFLQIILGLRELAVDRIYSFGVTMIMH